MGEFLAHTGVRGPESTGQFRAWFDTETACLAYLEHLRWPGGFVCWACRNRGGWRTGDGRYKCAGCGVRTTVTAGTLFDRRRVPLTVWFAACWRFVSREDGVSALTLQQSLDIGSYATAWSMLHRLRSVLDYSGRDRLAGTVEIAETRIDEHEYRVRGGPTGGDRPLLAVAVERRGDGIGRVRMRVSGDEGGTLDGFVVDHVAPDARILTTDRPRYRTMGRYHHVPVGTRAGQAREQPPPEHPPGPHQVAAWAGRWLQRTHPGSVDWDHLPNYLNEFAFRFNHRHTRGHGAAFDHLLGLAVHHGPVRYRDLVAGAGRGASRAGRQTSQPSRRPAP